MAILRMQIGVIFNGENQAKSAQFLVPNWSFYYIFLCKLSCISSLEKDTDMADSSLEGQDHHRSGKKKFFLILIFF